MEQRQILEKHKEPLTRIVTLYITQLKDPITVPDLYEKLTADNKINSQKINMKKLRDTISELNKLDRIITYSHKNNPTVVIPCSNSEINDKTRQQLLNNNINYYRWTAAKTKMRIKRKKDLENRVKIESHLNLALTTLSTGLSRDRSYTKDEIIAYLRRRKFPKITTIQKLINRKRLFEHGITIVNKPQAENTEKLEKIKKIRLAILKSISATEPHLNDPMTRSAMAQRYFAHINWTKYNIITNQQYLYREVVTSPYVEQFYTPYTHSNLKLYVPDRQRINEFLQTLNNEQ